MRRLAADNWPASAIATELTATFRAIATRNAVIGFCQRKKIALNGAKGFARPQFRPSEAGKVGGVASGQKRLIDPSSGSGKALIRWAKKPNTAAPVSPPPIAGAAAGGGRETDPRPAANALPELPAAMMPPIPSPAINGGQALKPTDLPAEEFMDDEAVDYDPALDHAYDPMNFALAPEGYFGPTRFIEARSNQCRWFTTDLDTYDAPVCGGHVITGYSYCDEHARRVHTTAGLDPKRRRELEVIRERRKHMSLSIAGA